MDAVTSVNRQETIQVQPAAFFYLTSEGVRAVAPLPPPYIQTGILAKPASCVVHPDWVTNEFGERSDQVTVPHTVFTLFAQLWWPFPYSASTQENTDRRQALKSLGSVRAFSISRQN